MSFPQSKPVSSSTRPAPTVSGSSVTSGRCCAKAAVEQHTASSTATSDARFIQSSRRSKSRTGRNGGPEFGRRIEPGVEQVARRDVAQGLEHRVFHAGMLDFELHDQLL